METIIVASTNKHKLKEIKEIYADTKILTMQEIGFSEEIVEDGNSFLENALIKAKTVSTFAKERGLNYPVLADDSGLEVNSLNGEPGIYSARYASDHDFKKNRDYLIKKLSDKEDKSANFTCCMVKYYPNGKYIYSIGKTYGTIISEEKGDTAFGYDCIFYSDDLKKTFGEASDEEKNSVSHRKRALEGLKEQEK